MWTSLAATSALHPRSRSTHAKHVADLVVPSCTSLPERRGFCRTLPASRAEGILTSAAFGYGGMLNLPTGEGPCFRVPGCFPTGLLADEVRLQEPLGCGSNLSHARPRFSVARGVYRIQWQLDLAEVGLPPSSVGGRLAL